MAELETRLGLLAIAGPDVVRYTRFGFGSDSIRAYHYLQIMKPSFSSLEDFDLSKATVLVGDLPWTQGQRPSGILVLPSSFPEARLYALLKALFGRPKGMMSITLHPEGDPDALFKYEFSIKLPDDTRLSIMRSWLNVEVHFWGRKLELKEVIRLFTFNFELHKEEVRKSLEDLEVYRLIINPHFRHKKMMNFFQEELKHTNPHVPTLPKTLLVTAKESTYYAKIVRAYVKEMERQNCFAVSLVMESAYTAESYLNLVLALARNDVLQANPKMFSDALHETWRDKIERLPLHCKMVSKQPSLEDPPVKNLERVFRLRNKIAHSYPDREDLCVAKIWFDQRIPLLPACESHVLYQCGVNSLLPRREEALEFPDLVEKFIDYVDSLLDGPAKESVQRAGRSNPLGFSETTQRYGVPYGEDIGMGFFTAR